MTSLTVEPIYDSLPLAIFVSALTLAVVLMITPPTDQPRQRRWLIGLRVLAAIALLLALLRPAFVQTDRRPAEAALIVAVDLSKSMTLPDGNGSDRWTVQRAAWKNLANGLSDIDDRLDVRLIGYDQSARSLDANPNALDSLDPDGNLTDLGAAGEATLEAAQGQPIAGVVLIGDGTQTALQTGAGIGRVAETLASLGSPLWTVPIGPAGGRSASRDVAIQSLAESFQLFAGNQANINFQVSTRGLVGIAVPIRIAWIATDGTKTEVSIRKVTPTKAVETVALTIPVTAPAPGSYRLSVQAEQQDGEVLTTNNMQTAFVDVREGGGRIFYVEGALRNEQSYLRRSLRRFQDLDLTFRSVLGDSSRRWPIDFNDAFEPGNFDIYIIGDLDADAIGSQQLEQLAETIAAGAGLITLGGYQTYGAGGYATSPLADAIPVKMDQSRRRSGDTSTADRDDQLTGEISIRPARRHPIINLGGDNPLQIWQQLPPMIGANRLIGPKIAPGVEVLLENSDGQPLMVVGQYGRGRTAALGFDSTWRWWRGGNRDAHRRFWRQLMLWLLSRQESGDKIVIEIDSQRFASDEPIQFRAQLQSIGDTSPQVDLYADLVDSNNRTKELEFTRDSDASGIRGQLPKMAPGFYRLRVRPEQESESLPAVEKAFQVIDESRELASPMADPSLLRQLAGITSEQGGAAFEPDDIDALVETVKNRRRDSESPIVEKFRLGDGPVSGWILFTLFAGALSAEWLLRRRWGLA